MNSPAWNRSRTTFACFVIGSMCGACRSAMDAELVQGRSSQPATSYGVSRSDDTPVVPQDSDSVLDRLDVYGDVRLRQEDDFALDDRPSRDRQRIRMRFGANYRATDEVSIGARVVTGNPDDPNSTHVTFGDAFDSLDLSLDRAFLEYRPPFLEGTVVTLGKFHHSITRNPIYGELVWDADVQPEGVLVRRSLGAFGPFQSSRVMAGGYVLAEQSTADDAHLLFAEWSGRIGLGEATTSDVAVSYYGYSDVTPDGSSVLLVDNAGNATLDADNDGLPDAFVSEFGTIDTLATVTWSGWRHPITFAAEFFENLRANVDDDRGWATGIALGGGGSPGDWRLYYQWQVVEQDAVFSAFAQDDFLLATNHRSHLFGAKYQLSAAAGLHLWSLVSARERTAPGPTTDSERNQWRVRLDINFKF